MATRKKTNRIITHFPETDLRCAHKGLTAIAMKAKKNPYKLKPGEYLIFTNKALTTFKMFAGGSEALLWYKCPQGTKLTTEIIINVPKLFLGSAMNISKITADQMRKLDSWLKLKKAA